MATRQPHSTARNNRRCWAYVVEFDPEVRQRVEQGLTYASAGKLAVRGFCSASKFAEHYTVQRFGRNDLVLLFVSHEFASEVAQQRADGQWAMVSNPHQRGTTQLFILTEPSDTEPTTRRQLLTTDDDLELHLNTLVRNALGRHKLLRWKRITIWAITIWLLTTLALAVALAI